MADQDNPPHGSGLYLAPDGAALVGVHDPLLCAGRGCVIHHPSGHLLQTWPVAWRDRFGFVTAERICTHGEGHPDPDDLTWHLSQGRQWMATHACDGCCAVARST